jgi:hypothetical protein
VNKPTPIERRFQKAKDEMDHLWSVQCSHFEIDPKSSFVVFPDDNPFAEEYSVAVAEFMAAKKALLTARDRNRKSRENRRAMSQMCKDMGIKRVVGVVTGQVYYE